MALPTRGREAYRAIYLASPLKFHTTLNAFTRTNNRFYIEPWKKDPQAAERHKWHSSQSRKRGRWFYRHGPLMGLRLDGWPDPGLLGSAELVQVAVRAQQEQLEDKTFWLHVAERAYKLRDVLRVGDVALILDVLVSANYRHVQLMKTLVRELLDDVEKLSFVELAVVANAYAHFNCFSEQMLQAFAEHAVRLLTGEECGPYQTQGSDVASDPNSLRVLAAAYASFGRRDKPLFCAINEATVEHANQLSFDSLSKLWVSFAKLRVPFVAPAEFWEAAANSVPGSRMTSLCPALGAVARLKCGHAQFRETLVAEILKGLQEAPAPSPPLPFGAAFDVHSDSDHGEPVVPHGLAAPSLPAFNVERLPRSLLSALCPQHRSAQERRRPQVVKQLEAGGEAEPDRDDVVVEEWSDNSIFQAPREETAEEATQDQDRPKGRIFYNAVSRRLSRAARPEYSAFDPQELARRNNRGAYVAEALEGLNVFWRTGASRPASSSSSGSSDSAEAPHTPAAPAEAGQVSVHPLAIPPGEAALLEAAAPILGCALEGVAAPQLTACVEAYAFHAEHASGTGDQDVVVRQLVQEGFRKLSNFSFKDIKRLHGACLQLGIQEPYLERASMKKFPRAFRLELRKAQSPPQE